MRRDKTNGLSAIMPAVALMGLGCFQAVAQTPTPPAAPGTKNTPAAQGTRKTTVSTRVNPVIVQSEHVAPQIVTILHRLTGLKVIRQLFRYNEELGAIANLDEAFKITHDVHTNVIAGLALDDGETIAAWLPEAAAEMPPPAVQFAPKAPAGPKGSTPPQMPVLPRMSLPGVPSISFANNFLEPADLKVITRDGKRLAGRYIGLDGLTGLSVIALANSGLPRIVDPKNEIIVVGQRLRVIGPQPAPPEPGTLRAMYFRVGQTDATVVNVSRSPSGALARIKVRAAKLSSASMGSIAINDAGETVGIVDSVQGSEASIVPVALVRSAAKRVIARQASVPRPWLGIRGEPIGAMSLEKIQGEGWKLDRARELVEKRCGILLTSVIPGSPAALKKLKPGDVILSVNNEDIRNGEEFTWRLQEAGPGNSVSFVIARPGQVAVEALQIELSESPDPLFGRRTALGHKVRPMQPGSLMAQGIEAIQIKPKVAMRFGATGGLLVVYVQPATEAFKAGLRPGDVIEAIDGQQLLSGSRSALLKNPGTSSTFNVVRNKQKLTVTISTSKHTAE
ncbi:MAG: PDZ domain-containing protein [Acidobacteriota bacterium]